jgi:hypothetical protein
VQFVYLPTIRAQLALIHRDASKAIELLQPAAHYELGQTGNGGVMPALYPVWVRGEAYRVSNQGSEAAREFQKILDHRGVVMFEPIGALAHLGMARAYALQGDTAKAHVKHRPRQRLKQRQLAPPVARRHRPKSQSSPLHPTSLLLF